jgi:phosphopantetheinyl transferase
MKLIPGIRIRYQAIASTLALVPQPHAGWLGADESRELDRLTDAHRRNQWLAGRWLAKQLITETAGPRDLADLQVLTRDHRNLGVRPRIVSRAGDLGLVLSIAHTDSGVLVAIGSGSRRSLGVDLAPRAVPADEGFCRLWFSPLERQWIEHDPAARVAQLWTIKEAVYKAANTGQSWSPRDVQVHPRGAGGFECSYRGRSLDDLSIELGHFDNHLAAVAVLPRGTAGRRVDRNSQVRPAAAENRLSPRNNKSNRYIVGH